MKKFVIVLVRIRCNRPFHSLYFQSHFPFHFPSVFPGEKLELIKSHPFIPFNISAIEFTNNFQRSCAGRIYHFGATFHLLEPKVSESNRTQTQPKMFCVCIQLSANMQQTCRESESVALRSIMHARNCLAGIKSLSMIPNAGESDNKPAIFSKQKLIRFGW